MKSIYFKFLILAILSQTMLVSCSEESNDNPRITFPLLSECKTSVLDYLNEMPSLAGLSFRVIKFDHIIESHPSIIGYVEIETKIDSKEGLVMIFNTIKSNCYPETSTTVYVDDSLGQEVSDLLNINRKMGVGNTYFVVDGANLKAYYHNKN